MNDPSAPHTQIPSLTLSFPFLSLSLSPFLWHVYPTSFLSLSLCIRGKYIYHSLFFFFPLSLHLSDLWCPMPTFQRENISILFITKNVRHCSTPHHHHHHHQHQPQPDPASLNTFTLLFHPKPLPSSLSNFHANSPSLGKVSTKREPTGADNYYVPTLSPRVLPAATMFT